MLKISRKSFPPTFFRKKARKRKNSKNGEVKSESKSSESISPTLIPKRESLRRVLELSKRTFEDQNNEKDTGNTTGSQSDTSDAESDAGKILKGPAYWTQINLSDSEPEENEKSTSDEQDNETPKIKLKNVPTPTKIRSETNPKTESTDVSISIDSWMFYSKIHLGTKSQKRTKVENRPTCSCPPEGILS